MEPGNLSLDQYILDASGAATPRVCFVGTASGDAQSFIDRFYAAFGTLNSRPSHISLFKLEPDDLRERVLEQDVMYVGGGNTRAMLAVWREWEFDRILREAWEAGVVLAGISAGSICWFEQGLSDSVGRRSCSRSSVWDFFPAAIARITMARRSAARATRSLCCRGALTPDMPPTTARRYILPGPRL